MKKLLILTAVFLGFTFSNVDAGNHHHKRNHYYKTINVNYFYAELEPYGEWIDIGYDDYVWRPYRSDRFWKPYSEGRWEWTRNGWYWVSYEPFGWATYHYGRWFYDDYYGWVWMPDDVWAPAWVEWRYNDFYIGWAPLPPYATFRPRTGIYFSISWHSNHNYWNFVNYNHFVSFNVHNYYVDNSTTRRIFRKTKYRTNYFTDNNRIVNAGVSRRFVEKRIGKKLVTRDINRTNRLYEYKTGVKKSRKSIVEYRPSEKRLSKKYNFDERKVKKGRELKSLKKDKVILNKRSKTNNKTIKRNVERKTEKNFRKNRSSKNLLKNNKIAERKYSRKATNRVETKSSRFTTKNSRINKSKNKIKSRDVAKTYKRNKVKSNRKTGNKFKSKDVTIRSKTKSRKSSK